MEIGSNTSICNPTWKHFLDPSRSLIFPLVCQGSWWIPCHWEEDWIFFLGKICTCLSRSVSSRDVFGQFCAGNQKISFINSSVLNRTVFCFFHWAILDLSFQHVISQVFSSLANKNVVFRAMHHLIENALFLPWSPFLVICLPVGQGKPCTAMERKSTRKSNHRDKEELALKTRSEVVQATILPRSTVAEEPGWEKALLHGGCLLKSLQNRSLLKFPIKCSQTLCRAALKTGQNQRPIHLHHSCDSQVVLVKPGFL